MPGDYDQAEEAYRNFGAYLRSQRQLAQLTLRQLAELSRISNPYLSQIERGLHQPSVAVVRAIAGALNLSADALLAQVAGLDDTDAAGPSLTTESAIRADPQLNSAQKAALLSVYRSMVGMADEPESGESAAAARQPSRRSRSSPAALAKRTTTKRGRATRPEASRPEPGEGSAGPAG